MEQREHITNIFKMKPSGFDPLIETHRETEDGLEYSSWKKYEGEEHLDERSVLPNELVIDIDAETTEECRNQNRQITSMLENQGLPFFAADTGGTGFHIHIFFQVPDSVNDISEMDSYRQALYKWLKVKAEEETQVDTDLWDDGMVDFESDVNNGHLVRAVGGRKTDTGLRKTEVLPSALSKEELGEKDDVEYPVLNPKHDFWRISKVDSTEADLTWTEITEKAEEIQEEKEEKRKQKLESTYEAEDDGLQALREIPAHEVFKAFFDIDAKPGDNIYCPIHGSSKQGTEEGKITEGKEAGLPEGVYGCFGDSCTEKGETIHWFNAIDLLTEGLNKDFQEAKKEIAEEFDVGLQDEQLHDSEELSLEEKDEKIQELIDDLQGMKDASALSKKKKKDEIYELLLNTPKSYRTEVFGDIPGRKRDNEKGFNEYLSDHIEETEGEEESLDSRYSEETIDRAEKLLEEEHILKKVKTVLDHRIAGEDVNKLGLFLQLLSKDTENPLMIFGIQKQGEGKSYLAKNVIELFPDYIVEKLTDATKSSIYRIAENEGKDFFDNKIVFFGEIPENEDDREVFQIFRQLNSEGEVQKRLTLDREDGMESAKLELEGSPVVISTTVNEGLIDEQDMSRGMAYSPEMSKKQNEKVRSFQNRAHEFPEHLLDPEDIDQLEETIECALDILSREEVKMQNPFTRDINNQVPDDSDNIKRDYPKTLKIAAQMPAYLYHRQRPKKEIHDREYTFVSWKDVARGIVINRKFINNMIRGRTESTMDAYEVIKEKVESADCSYSQMRTGTNDSDINVEADYFTNKDLEKWMGLASKTAAEYTRKLNKMELIFKESSTRPNRHYLIDGDKSETAGITLRSLYNIIASVSDREELSEWSRNYIEFNGLEGSVCEEDLIEMVAFTSDQLPLELDIGLLRDNSHTTPLYQQISEYKVDEATALKVEKDGSVIMYRSGSVSEQFSDEDSERQKDKDESETTSEDQDSSQGRSNRGLKTQVRKALADAGATDSGEPISFADLLKEVELTENQLSDVIDNLEYEGDIMETDPGDFQLLGEPVEVKAE